jgi:hypothetical protein
MLLDGGKPVTLHPQVHVGWIVDLHAFLRHLKPSLHFLFTKIATPPFLNGTICRFIASSSNFYPSCRYDSECKKKRLM